MVGTIKVVNVNSFDERKVDGEVINIMRPSILGNPFKMSSEDEREISVRKYYHYLREEFKKKEEVKTIVFRYIFIYYNRIRLYTGNPGCLPPSEYSIKNCEKVVA